MARPRRLSWAVHVWYHRSMRRRLRRYFSHAGPRTQQWIAYIQGSIFAFLIMLLLCVPTTHASDIPFRHRDATPTEIIRHELDQARELAKLAEQGIK